MYDLDIKVDYLEYDSRVDQTLKIVWSQQQK